MNQSRLTAALSKMLLHGKLNSDRSLKGTIRLSLVLQKHNDYLICSKTETHQRKSNRSHRIVGALQRVGEAPLAAGRNHKEINQLEIAIRQIQQHRMH